MARRFHFPLETLLRVRHLRERAAQRKVALKQAEIARIDGAIRDTCGEISACMAVLRDAQHRSRLDPAALARLRGWLVHLNANLSQQRQLRTQRQCELAALLADAARARTNRRVVEKLRERRWTEYARGLARRRQIESDDLARGLLARDREPGE